MAEPVTRPSRQQRMAEVQVIRRRAELTGDTVLPEQCDPLLAIFRHRPRRGFKRSYGARPGELVAFRNDRWVVTGS